MQTVLKPFNTVNRRFAAGATVTEADVPDFADKQARGFISGGSPAAVDAVSAEPDVAAEPAEPVVDRKKR